MKNIAVFASGSGSNFQAIMDAINKGELKAELKLLVSDKANAYCIERAENYNIPTYVFSAKDFKSKAEYEQIIVSKLREMKVEFIVLAGYMRLIGPTLLKAYEGKIVNIHPSLLPAFPGKDAIGQALAAGVEETGITIHYVDEGMDTGPAIAQQSIKIEANESIESLQNKIHEIEHQLYPKVLNQLLQENTN